MSRIGFIGLGIMGSPMAANKDMGIAIAAARDADVAAPMTGLVAQLVAGLRLAGPLGAAEGH
jgi:3-hydroxyisobutyrate dehydrogenase-like beta-hydroxyacid dehydrogenase